MIKVVIITLSGICHPVDSILGVYGNPLLKDTDKLTYTAVVSSDSKVLVRNDLVAWAYAPQGYEFIKLSASDCRIVRSR